MKAGYVNVGRLATSLLFAGAFVLGIGLAAQKSVGLPQSSRPSLRLSPEELEIYEHARTVVDLTPRQIKSVPFLRKLQLAKNQDELPVILDRTGKTATELFYNMPKIACDESVASETNMDNPLASWGGMGRNRVFRHFRYIVIPKMVGDIMTFDEYRTDAEGKPLDSKSMAGLKMITSNFSSNWTYFNPSEQNDSRFRYLGTESFHKHDCYVVGFAQKPGVARNVSGFQLKDEAATLLNQGIVWIDQQTFEVLEIRTWLLAPRKDIGLEYEGTTVDYSPVQPAGAEKTLWLPHEVVVTIVYRRAYFRNTHRYSNFKLFRVESTIKPTE